MMVRRTGERATMVMMMRHDEAGGSAVLCVLPSHVLFYVVKCVHFEFKDAHALDGADRNTTYH